MFASRTDILVKSARLTTPLQKNGSVREFLSLETFENFYPLKSILGITSFGVDIHAQNSGIHSQKSDSNHYFGVDSTILRVDFYSNEVIPNMTHKRMDFPSAALREFIITFSSVLRTDKMLTLLITDHIHHIHHERYKIWLICQTSWGGGLEKK